jgi:ankyrin repeat protein
MMGHTDTIWKLIERGASLGAPGSRQATGMMHSAVRHSSIDLLDLLAKRGLASTEPDEHQRLPLVEAVKEADITVVEWLLRHGANISATTEHGESAIAVAAMEDKVRAPVSNRQPLGDAAHCLGSSLC